MVTRLCMAICVAVLALAVIGCDPPPTCDANLIRLTNVSNYPTNVFKQPISASPALASNSAAIISRQVAYCGAQNNSDVRCSFGDWSHTVFYTDASQSKTTYITLQLWDGSPSWGGSTSFGPVRWRSCIRPGAADDAHSTVVDTVDGCTTAYWGLRGNYTTAASATGIPFTDASAVAEPGEGLLSNAGGCNNYNSMIWPDECTSGFDHGFMFATGWAVNNPNQISKPFYHCDGSGTHADDLFQGMQVQLNPAYDISGLPTYQRNPAQAMKTYGMFDGNSNGGNWGIYGPNKTGYTNNPWTGVLPDPSVTDFTIVPIAQFRVLAPNFTDERTFSANNSCATYYGNPGFPAAPTLTSLNPTSSASGTTCTLTGTNFGLSGTVKVRFGMTNASNVVVASSTQIRCTIPAGTGDVPVTVIQDGCSGAKTFTYSGGGSGPSLSSINPSNGSTAGGTACTLAGANLTGCSAVSFGGTAATGIVVDSSSQVRCTSPAGSGVVNVTATTPNGASNPVSYTYNGAPSLTAINPTSGTTAGGTAGTLTGTSLTGCSAVSFGGTAASGIVVDSATQVRCTSPAGSGTVNVTATTAYGTSNGVSYTYTAGGTYYTATLYSPADSYVISSTTSKNSGTTNYVIQKNASLEYATYVKFDMTSVQGATITSAILNLCTSLTPTSAYVQKIYSCATDSWSESTINWGNKPAWGTQQASFTCPSTQYAWVTVDVTSYINSQFNGDKLVTLVIRDDQSLNKNCQYYSDETGASTSRRPYLRVISQ